MDAIPGGAPVHAARAAAGNTGILAPLVAALAAGVTTIYAAAPSYAVAIVGLTIGLFIVTLPLQRANRSALAALAQAPVFFAVYRLLRGLVHRDAQSGLLAPLYLSPGTRLFHALSGASVMRSCGVDLAQTGLAALGASPWSAVVFVAVLAVSIGATLIQQHLHANAGTADDDPAARVQHLLRYALPVFAATWALSIPLVVSLYYATSSVLRLGYLIATRLG